MTTGLLPTIINPVLLAVLVATGLILPALPLLALRLVWVLATNPNTSMAADRLKVHTLASVARRAG